MNKSAIEKLHKIRSCTLSGNCVNLAAIFAHELCSIALRFVQIVLKSIRKVFHSLASYRSRQINTISILINAHSIAIFSIWAEWLYHRRHLVQLKPPKKHAPIVSRLTTQNRSIWIECNLQIENAFRPIIGRWIANIFAFSSNCHLNEAVSVKLLKAIIRGIFSTRC